MNDHDLLTETEASEYLGVPRATLRQWRYLGRGPSFVRLGGGRHIRYRIADLQAWISAHVFRPEAS